MLCSVTDLPSACCCRPQLWPRHNLGLYCQNRFKLWICFLIRLLFCLQQLCCTWTTRNPIFKKNHTNIIYTYIHTYLYVCMQPLFSLSQRWSSFLTFKLPSLHVAPMAEQKSSRPISGVARVTAGRGRRCVGGGVGVGVLEDGATAAGPRTVLMPH